MKQEYANTVNNNYFTSSHRAVNFYSDIRINGTLSIPDNNEELKPAVVLIPGSGPVDRDGNVKLLKSDMLLKLSDLFTQNGFVTLRYDKRGVDKSAGCYLKAGLTEFIDDAVSAARFLKNAEGVDSNRVIILGHSEGAFIAPAVYSQEPTNGLILLCGTATPTKDLLPLQHLKLIDEIKKKKGAKGFFMRLFRLNKIIQWQWNALNRKVLSSNKPVVKILGFKKFNAKWFRETHNYNVREYLPNVTCQTLVIGGEKDIQCIPSEVNDIANLIKGPCTAEIIPNMNHILCHYNKHHHLLSVLHEYKQSLSNGLSREFTTTLIHWLAQWKTLNFHNEASKQESI